MVVATPDFQPSSMTRSQYYGFADPRSASFMSCLSIIYKLSQDGTRPLNYMIENVPGAIAFASIIEALDIPLRVQAH